MMDFLRTLYWKAPVIRELVNLHAEVRQLRWITSIRMKAELDYCTSQLLRHERYSAPANLSKHERQVFSQGGEDGVIAEIFRRIGTTSKTFVEIGIGNGLENNTAFLVSQGCWHGHWIDSDEASLARIRRHFSKPVAEGRLNVTRSFVTAENVASTWKALHIPAEIDLLSLDIDRNTYWVWKALSQVHPRVVVAEYNASMPPDVDWKVDYVSDRPWNGSSYFGASLKAFELLGRCRGYCLVGCTLNGVNAFFVREDLCGENFEQPHTAEHHYEPPRYYLSYRTGHASGFTDDSEVPPAPWTPGM